MLRVLTALAAILILGYADAQPSEDVGESGGVSPLMPTGGMAAPRQRLLEEANLGGLGHVAMLAGVEANQAAGYFTNYVNSILSGTGADNLPRSSCFIQEREGDDTQESTNFLERLAEDYTGALGYSSYLQLLTDHFCQDPTRSDSYCAYLGDTRRTVTTMTQSLANLVSHTTCEDPVRFINESTYQSAIAAATTSLQSPDHKSSDTTGDKANTPLPTHCSDPCYEQQASVLGRLLTLAGKYLPTDVEGYMAGRDAK